MRSRGLSNTSNVSRSGMPETPIRRHGTPNRAMLIRI